MEREYQNILLMILLDLRVMSKDGSSSEGMFLIRLNLYGKECSGDGEREGGRRIGDRLQDNRGGF